MIYPRPYFYKGKQHGYQIPKKYCSLKCVSDAATAKTRGHLYPQAKRRFVGPDGYVVITRGKWRAHEHRLVMEEQLGRALTRAESVHNRPENLELWTSKHLGGIRVADLRPDISGVLCFGV